MKEHYSDQEKFVSYLLVFVFIFIIIVISVLALHYTGILSLRSEKTDFTSASDPTTNTLETYPSQTSDTNPLHSQSQTSEQISSSTKYPPATIPPYISSQTSSDKETSNTSKTSESTEQTTEDTQISPDAGRITAEDITDEKMSELITEKYLTIHKNSRPGLKLTSVDAIVVHYVANQGTTALQNWKNFENNKPNTSAHFIIDLDGSIIQCIPLNEVAWAIGTTKGNYTTISIECCHPDATGKFTEETYDSLVKLVSWLCAKFDFTEENVKRHYDYPRTTSSGFVWHKQCPLYFVNHPEKWEAFKDDLYIP